MLIWLTMVGFLVSPAPECCVLHHGPRHSHMRLWSPPLLPGLGRPCLAVPLGCCPVPCAYSEPGHCWQPSSGTAPGHCGWNSFPRRNTRRSVIPAFPPAHTACPGPLRAGRPPPWSQPVQAHLPEFTFCPKRQKRQAGADWSASWRWRACVLGQSVPGPVPVGLLPLPVLVPAGGHSWDLSLPSLPPHPLREQGSWGQCPVPPRAAWPLPSSWKPSLKGTACSCLHPNPAACRKALPGLSS